jgi:hypothetical protein
MRAIVPEAFLRDAISARMAAEPSIGEGIFWARPVRCKRKGDGPNWRHSFNPGAVPAGYTAAWERIRHKFENEYNMADE